MIAMIGCYISETGDSISKQVFVPYKIDMFELKLNLTKIILCVYCINYSSVNLHDFSKAT